MMNRNSMAPPTLSPAKTPVNAKAEEITLRPYRCRHIVHSGVSADSTATKLRAGLVEVMQREK